MLQMAVVVVVVEEEKELEQVAVVKRLLVEMKN
jgi:hypothetical protein